MASQPDLCSGAVPSEDTFLALCADDKCPWKHRGVTGPVTNLRGQEHANETGHSVRLYFEHRWTLTPEDPATTAFKAAVAQAQPDNFEPTGEWSR